MSPTTPRHKRLALKGAFAEYRASSTPPDSRVNKHLAIPPLTPSSRHSSPGIDRLQSRYVADELIPRRLTPTPDLRLKSKDKVRRRMSKYHSFDHAVQLLRDAKNVVVLSGAGISTSLDIPDFRSDNGFYARLSSDIGLSTAEEFFSIDFFTHNNGSFWENVKPLLPQYAHTKSGEYQNVDPKVKTPVSKPRYSSAHALLAMLQSRGALLTNYTQNIDGLEFAAGVKKDYVIQCHGSWDTASCITCGKTISARKYLPIVHENGRPMCKCAGSELSNVSPVKPLLKKRAKKRKRALYEGDSDHSSDDGTSIPKGLYKPDITFFGEAIPEAYDTRLAADKGKVDLLLIMGTSLKVRPVKSMLVDFEHVPQIWINRERYSGRSVDMPGVHVDIELLGECDLVVEELCRKAGCPLDKFLWREDEKIFPVRAKEKAARHSPQKRDGAKAVLLGGAAQNGTNLGAKAKSHSCDDVKAGNDTVLEEEKQSLLSDVQPVQPPNDIRIISDLDAEWRWRISKRPLTAPSTNGG